MPQTMKAVRQHQFGGPEVLLYEDAPKPTLTKNDQVLIRVQAAGVNPVDWKTRTGHGMTRDNANPFPLILGWDISGIVEEAGADVIDFIPDDNVYGMVWFPQTGNAYAEYVVAQADHLTHKPTSIDHSHAAAVPLAALTAWQALHETAHIQAGQRVLIHAAAGGVGHFGVQFAKIAGATVIGTASAQNADFLRSIGVDQVIDYQNERFEDVLSALSVDTVLDCVGGETSNRSIPILKPGGWLVAITSGLDEERARSAGLNAEYILVHPDQEQLAEIAALIDAGKVKVEIGGQFPLSEAHVAHALSETRHFRGKIVLTI